jgi:hypothetical protein
MQRLRRRLRPERKNEFSAMTTSELRSVGPSVNGRPNRAQEPRLPPNLPQRSQALRIG